MNQKVTCEAVVFVLWLSSSAKALTLSPLFIRDVFFHINNTKTIRLQ